MWGPGVDYSGQDLSGRDLRYSDFTNAKFLNANLSNTTLVHAGFVNADLRNANLSGANLGVANFTGANLDGATFTGAVFNGETIWPAGFNPLNKGMWGPGVDYSGQDLSGKNFTWFDFTGVNFTGANLTGANLRGASLRLVNAVGADFGDVDLAGTDLSMCRYDGATTWPSGFDPRAAGAIPVARLSDGLIASAPVTLVNRTPVAERGNVVQNVGTLFVDKAKSVWYEFIAGEGAADNDKFVIVGDQLRLLYSQDHETTPRLFVRVKGTDESGRIAETPLTIEISDVNEMPTDVVLSATSIAENAGANAIVGTLSTIDPDAANTFTYSLVAGVGSTDNASFTLAGNELKATLPFNFEAKNSYSVRVRSTDAGGLFTEKALTLSVTDVAEATSHAPTSIDLANTAWLYWNNGGTIWRSKADGTDKMVIASPTSGSAITTFDIDKVNERLYFAEEVPSAASHSKIYSTAIDGSDRKTIYSGTGLGHIGYSLTVDATAGYVFLHSHDPAPVAAVGPFYDGKVQRVSILTGAITILPTTFWYVHDLEVSTTSTLYLAGFSDFTDKSTRFFSQQLDGTATQEVAVTGLATLNFALAERTNSIYVATDSQSATTGDIYRVPLAGGAPTIIFNGTQTIWDVEYEEPTGLLYWLTNDSIYRSSAQGTNAQAIVTGMSTNAGNHLSFVTSPTTSVSENCPNGTLVGFLSTSDADSGDTFTYSLVSGAGSDGNTGFEVTDGQLRAKAGLDFEAKRSHAVRIRSMDQSGLFTEKAFTITVTNVNEPPTSVTLANALAALPENTLTTTRVSVADIAVADDLLGTSALALSGPDAAFFRIVGRQLFLRAGVKLDHEITPFYNLTVSVADPSLPGSKPVSVPYRLEVANVNEAPTAITLTKAVSGLLESTSTMVRVRVADILVADDTLGSATLALSGPDASFFRVVGSQLFLRAGSKLDYETKASYSAIITAFDTTVFGSVPVSVPFALSLLDVNEPPASVSLVNLVPSLPESTKSIVRIKVADIVVRDDMLGTNTLTLSGPDATAFKIFGSELCLRATTPLDYETKKSYAVTVTATDHTLPASTPVSVDYQLPITDVNESPTILPAFTINGGKQNTPLEITHAALLAASQARDPEAASPSFLVETVNTGSVQRWTGTAWVTVSTLPTSPVAQRQLGPGQKIRWTPSDGATGLRAAFQVKASDGQQISGVTAQVSVSID